MIDHSKFRRGSGFNFSAARRSSRQAIMAAAILLLSCGQASPVTAADTASYDNLGAHYVLPSLPTSEAEGLRMQNGGISDAQPAGLFARKGDRVSVRVAGLQKGYKLSVRVGFPPMTGDHNVQQVMPLRNGQNTLTATNVGPLTFTHSGPIGKGTVAIDVTGAKPMPFFVDGVTSLDGWQSQLRQLAQAPFVTLVSRRSMITMSMPTYRKHPIADPAASLAMIEKVITWEDELAGFDGSAPVHMPTSLRTHYIEDTYASPAEREEFYMYAMGSIVGMLDYNTGDLTDPAMLSKKWGIWHETGHTKQQSSWTWDSLTEINVNLFSLYVQEKFGLPSRVRSGEGDLPPTVDMAQDYLAAGPGNYLEESSRENTYFEKLVMFHQLKQVYGWPVFIRLHKAMREKPGSPDASDQQKANRFISQMCIASGNNLMPFFAQWGLRPDGDAAVDAICTKRPLPKRNIAAIK